MLWLIRQSALLDLLGRYPAMARLVIRALAGRLLHTNSLIEELSLRPVTARLAKLRKLSMVLNPVKTAVIGCGNISSIYLENAATWDILDMVACADLDLARAESQAAKFNIPRAAPVADVLADADIELIINLTIPAAHAEIGLAALRAGKSVYNEKPLAISREEGRQLLQEAQARGLRVGNAPDTFLGGGLQTCRQLIDAGEIGTPVAATGFMFIQGPEAWHPDPAFLYQVGAGPLFDMGPYYLTALISMLGPIRRVTGSARITYPERTIGSGPKQGQKIPVDPRISPASSILPAARSLRLLPASMWRCRRARR